MHEGPTENRLDELGSLYKYKYNILIWRMIILIAQSFQTENIRECNLVLAVPSENVVVL